MLEAMMDSKKLKDRFAKLLNLLNSYEREMDTINDFTLKLLDDSTIARASCRTLVALDLIHAAQNIEGWELKDYGADDTGDWLAWLGFVAGFRAATGFVGYDQEPADVLREFRQG